MKRFFVFVISFVLLFNVVECFAVTQGDLDNDSCVTINDARYALRIASGIELCDVNSDKFSLMDFNGDNVISLSDVRQIMLIATGVSESVIDGIKVTSLPAEFNGLTINSFLLDDTKATINVTNNTGKAIDELSSISYKCYDSNGTILKTASVYLEDMNNGENCEAIFYIEKGTAKILFTGATVRLGEHKEETQTSLICGLNVTSLPATFNGLTINSFSLDDTKATINVTNNTGKAIDELSSISYKCYDSNGTILKTASVYLEDMNNGENCEAIFYIEKGTTKILFTGATVRLGEHKEETQTSLICGLSVTSLPATFNGLTINSFLLDDTKATINVTNNTGKAIDELSSISYKCYDSNGTILKTASVYLEDMNNGENCEAIFYIEKGTTKILFTGATVRLGEHKEETQTSLICGLSVTSLPATFNGLTINSFLLDDTKATINVTNNTGKAIDELSSISYKCYDSNGTILKTASVYLEDMNNGENCEAIFYIEKGTAKILFTGATVRLGEHKEETQTSLICGLNVTSLPATFNGLTINSFSLDDTKATINVTNNTGKAIDELSSISYKCYDSNGTILKTASVYLEDMNNGENCEAIFYIEKGTTKILFTGATVYV